VFIDDVFAMAFKSRPQIVNHGPHEDRVEHHNETRLGVIPANQSSKSRLPHQIYKPTRYCSEAGQCEANERVKNRRAERGEQFFHTDAPKLYDSLYVRLAILAFGSNFGKPKI
jgi:hypothetical protein